MEIASRPFWTVIHGMGFGGLYLLLCTGLLVEMYHRFYRRESSADGPLLTTLLILMSVFAWLAVLTGTYAVYPWYRAVPPAGTTDLAGYPQKLLLSHASTAGWHSMGMEWKEHVAWLVPIAITMAAGVMMRYRNDLRHHPQLRSAVMAAVLVSVAAAGLGGFVMAVLAIVADHQPAFKKMLIFSAPVGALSGESTCAVAVWLVSWALLDVLWKRHDVRSAWIGVGLGLLVLSFVLMIPAVGDLF